MFQLRVVEPEAETSSELTRLLRAWSSGEVGALERLTPIVYSELHRIARQRLVRERENHLLQPSALVNEAYLRLMATEPVEWQNRNQFFANCAKLMRHILIDFARAQYRQKRGGGSPHVEIQEAIHVLTGTASDPLNLIDLDRALERLAELDARQAQVVELRYFGGLLDGEIAEVLGVSEPTVRRDWRVARAWLYSMLRPGEQLDEC